MALQAWEAVVWGDKTYCVFVMAAPPATTWSGVAGFVKAVFRWNAPPTQMMEISGIEASAPHDPTLRTDLTVYAGMMNAAAKWRAGSLTDTAFVAGELAFISATTNNQSVLVDFSSWVADKNKNALVLGNVSDVNPPTYAEALYIALDNGDGTVSVILDDAASRAKVMPAGMTNSVVELNAAYLAWQAGLGPKPVPRRCGGALYLNTWYGEPVPAGKCDAGLTWAPGFCVKYAEPWSTVAGTVAPMNSYMTLTKGRGRLPARAHRGQQLRPHEDRAERDLRSHVGAELRRPGRPLRRRDRRRLLRPPGQELRRLHRRRRLRQDPHRRQLRRLRLAQQLRRLGRAQRLRQQHQHDLRGRGPRQHPRRVDLRARLPRGLPQGARQRRPGGHGGRLRWRGPAALPRWQQLEPDDLQQRHRPLGRHLHPHHLRRNPGRPDLLRQHQRRDRPSP